MIQYFWKGLKPLIRVKIEQRNWELDSFKNLMEKEINASPALFVCPKNWSALRPRLLAQAWQD